MAGIKRCCENWGEAAQGTAGWAESRDSRSAGVDPLGSHRFKQREERAVVPRTKRERKCCSATASSNRRSCVPLTARQDPRHMSTSPAITRSATTMPAVCDGEAKKTASAARTSKAPVVSTANREALFDGVSRPSRCGAAGLCRWLVDQVTRPSRRSTLLAEGRSIRLSRSRNANRSG
jgi:hypothetical protein